MPHDSWKPPAWNLPLEEVSLMEAFKVPQKSPISEFEWPEMFWKSVQERTMATEEGSKALLALFRELEVAEPARCHLPPFGLGAYCKRGTLLFTTTLCFECGNAFVYTKDGLEQRAMDVSTTSAKNLLETLKYHFGC